MTPQQDTVEVLFEFAERRGVSSPRWHLLTGDKELIYRLGRSVYWVEEDLGEARGQGDFLHTESIVLLDGDRRLRGIYNGVNTTSVNQLVQDAQALIAEAEQELAQR